MKRLTIHDVIRAAERDPESVDVTAEGGAPIGAKRVDGVLSFVVGDEGPMPQEAFFERYRQLAFSAEGDPGEAKTAEPIAFPELDDAVEWAYDDAVSDDDVNRYLVEVAGDNGLARTRESMIERVEAYVEKQGVE